MKTKIDLINNWIQKAEKDLKSVKHELTFEDAVTAAPVGHVAARILVLPDAGDNGDAAFERIEQAAQAARAIAATSAEPGTLALARGQSRQTEL